MDIDDLKNPEFRKGRRNSVRQDKEKPVFRPAPTEHRRRAQFAAAAARAAFGRFYWNDALERRLERELEKSHRQQRQAAIQQARRGKRNSVDK